MVDTPRPPGAHPASEELNAAVGPGAGVVAADLWGARLCDTSGIHALVMAHQRATAAKTGFRLAAGPGEVRRVRDILHLGTALSVPTVRFGA